MADVYDAMSQARPYRPALNKLAIQEELRGPGYDQEIVRLLYNYLYLRDNLKRA